MYVFPGGGVSEADRGSAPPDDPPLQLAAERSRSTVAEIWASAQCAARELSEEADVLLPATDLVLADHWVTPEIEPRRFDVRFFVTALPPGARAQAGSTESDEGGWITPAAAIDRFHAGDMPMLRPTVAVFEWLATHPTVASAVAQAARLEVRPKLPVRVDPDDPMRWRLVDARTGEVLEEIAQGPRLYETDGTLIEQSSPPLR